MGDDLHSLKDDMTAFILGNGLSRFNAYISEEMESVLWDNGSNADAWKDFVELSKVCGVKFLTFSEDILDKEDIEFLLERMQNAEVTLDDELEDARLLRTHSGKLGFIQLGFPHQGIMFLYEVSTPWYDRYQQLLETSGDFGSIMFDERDKDDEF